MPCSRSPWMTCFTWSRLCVWLWLSIVAVLLWGAWGATHSTGTVARAAEEGSPAADEAGEGTEPDAANDPAVKEAIKKSPTSPAKPAKPRAASSATGVEFVDHSVLVAPELPCHWSAGFPPFDLNPYEQIGPLGIFNSDILTIDEHTGTQFDAPAHFVPPADSGLPNAGPQGSVTGEKVPVWQFVGEACVIDCQELIDSAPKGESALITRPMIQAWEKKHRELGAGDVVIFRSGYSDKFYRPLPGGRRLIADPLDGKTPGWPDPDPACMEYLAIKHVRALATDSPSMGPIPGDLPVRVHVAGLKYGLIWTELGTNFGSLPATGAMYCIAPVKHAGSSGGECRAFALQPGPLTKDLLERAKAKRIADLSLLLSEDHPCWWPGAGTGNHRCPYYNKVVNRFGRGGPYLAQTHRMDSHTGTHLVPPAYALPLPGEEAPRLSAEAQQWLKEYESKHGPRGTSEVTVEQVPLDQTCGLARVIDVSSLVGTTKKEDWPASPVITVEHIVAYEEKQGPIKPGEIVIFASGYSDERYRPFPEGDAYLKEPLDGKREAWPAPNAEAIAYLAQTGCRCVGTDGPTLGSVDPQQAAFTYWMLGTQGMVAVESLTGVRSLPAGAYFLFAPVKIRDSHGGPGRALAILPKEAN